MIKKEKKCKGTGKAKGHGCGELKTIHRYGLCSKCFAGWLYNTDEGKILLNNSAIRAKKSIERTKRLQAKKEKQEIKKKSEFEKELQTEINSIVRLLDVDKGCISCDHGWTEKWTRQAHAGHYYSVGSDPTLRFNLLNIWKQCSICNNWKSGNERKYEIGLTTHYGKEVVDKIKQFKSKYKSINLTKDDLIEKIKIARRIKKDILSGKNYTREQINNELGIYNDL